MKDDFEQILANAAKMKRELREHKKGQKPQEPLKGKVLGMVFEKPSLRTRISFEVGMGQLGGKALYIGPDEVSIGKRESVSDVANVLSRYVNCIMYRAFSNQNMRELARHASVPVVNGEGVTLAALTELVPISRINPERRAAILADVGALGGDLSDHVSWLPSFSARRA